MGPMVYYRATRSGRGGDSSSNRSSPSAPNTEVQPTSVAPFARRQSALLDPVLARPQHELFEVRLRSCEELLISVLAFPSGGG